MVSISVCVVGDTKLPFLQAIEGVVVQMCYNVHNSNPEYSDSLLKVKTDPVEVGGGNEMNK